MGTCSSGIGVVGAVALVGVSRAAGDHTSDNISLPGSDSTAAQNLLQDRLPQQAYGANPLVLKVKSGKLTDSKSSQAVADTVAGEDTTVPSPISFKPAESRELVLVVGNAEAGLEADVTAGVNS